jgi:hypothetical protein
MRTRGLQWVEFKTAWSSGADEVVGTVEDLTGHLKQIIAEGRERRQEGELPEQAPTPIMKRKGFKELGTLTPQAEELAERHTELTPEQLREAAEKEQDRLEQIGKIDRVGDGQPDLPKDWQAWDTLVGRQIEVRWRYWIKDSTRKSGRQAPGGVHLVLGHSRRGCRRAQETHPAVQIATAVACCAH